MEIIADSREFQVNRETAIAIGKFDGVHVGHRRLLEEILEKKAEGLAACVFTFDTSPAVLLGKSDGKVLTTREEKRRILQEIGVDLLVEFPMTPETMAMEAQEFALRILLGALDAKMIAAGEDLSFGSRGLGNVQLLRKLSETYHFDVDIIPKVCIDGKEVSSTYIRGLLEQGKMEQVKSCLGEFYSVSGTVQHGHGIGHTLGFPTANLIPPSEKLLPPFGVYLSRVRVGEKFYDSISNVGKKPTVSGKEQLGVESFLYDFEGDLYGREIEVFLHEYCRPERKFENMEALKAQLRLDIEAGRINLRTSSLQK